MPGEACVVTDTADTRRQSVFSAFPELFILLLRDLIPRDARGRGRGEYKERERVRGTSKSKRDEI